MRSILLCTFLFITFNLSAQLLETTAFSQAHGLYQDEFMLTITSPIPNATIRYTLNASTPSTTSGIFYTGAIPITNTTMVRAIAWTATDTSEVITQTYIFPEQVLEQFGVPSGYPAEFVPGLYDADYDMDPEIVGDSVYNQLLRAGFSQIPTASIVTDVKHLFDKDTGIYMNSEESGVEWERPASLEIIYPDGKSFQVNAGVRMYGNSSREPDVTPKHSFRFLFKGEYGPKKLDFPVFERDGADKFDTFIFRAGLNYTWVTEKDSFSQRNSAAYMRDQFARNVHYDMGYPTARGLYVHMYVNGLYWGLYNLSERPDGAFAAGFFGGDKDDYDVLNSGFEVAESSDSTYRHLLELTESNLSDDANYEKVLEYIDLDNFIDYLILNHYIGNFNWDHHNWYAARKKRVGAKWYFFAWDSESIFHQSVTNAVESNNDGNPTGMLYSMINNEEFKIHFADHIHRHLFNCGIMTPESVSEKWDNLASVIDTAIVGESARWGDYRRDVHVVNEADLYTLDYWLAEQNRLHTELFPVRSEIVVQQYIDEGFYPNIHAPVYNEACDMEVPSGFVLMMSNLNNSGDIYYTTDDSDPRLPGGSINSSAVNGASLANLTITETTIVKSRIKIGDEWSALQETTFFVDGGLVDNLVIKEIMYNPLGGSSDEFIELKNLTNQSVNLTGFQLSTGIAHDFAPGTTIPANGFLVLGRDVADFQAAYGIAPDGVYDGKLNNAGERVTLIDGIGNVIDEVTYLDTIPWDIDADGRGTSLEFVVGASDNNLAQNWVASALNHGTPKAENQGDNSCAFSNPYIVINEINYNSSPYTNPGDWIELFNPTAEAVDISAWSLLDEGNHFEFANGTIIPPNDYLVLVSNDTTFKEIFPTITNFVAPAGFNLSGSTERIRLVNNQGCEVDRVIYEDQLPWPLLADGAGHTLQLSLPNLDNMLATSWEASQDSLGTPGYGLITMLTVNLGADMTLCQNESLVLNATVPGCSDCTYLWSTGEMTASITAMLNTSMTYSVTVTSGALTTSDELTITYNPEISITAMTQAPSCFNEANGSISTTVTGGSGGFTFVWTNGDLVGDLTNLSAGIYETIVTDAAGCEASESFVLANPEELLLDATVQNILCNGENNGSIIPTGSGGTGALTYTWSDQQLFPDNMALPAGTYTITVTDANNCTAENMYEISEPTTISFTTDNSTISCNGDADATASIAAMGGTGALTYAWSNGATTATQDDLAAGEYSFTITDANNCIASGAIAITEPEPLSFATLSITTISCGIPMSGALSIEPGGGTPPYAANWNTGATTFDLENLDVGTYIVTITDANNCQITQTFSIEETSGVIIAGEVENVSCFGEADGSIFIPVVSNTNYTYEWSNGANLPDQSGLPAGEYTITVTNLDDGCTAEETYIIEEPEELSFNFFELLNASCGGLIPGFIEVIAVGGTGELTYEWSTGATTPRIENLDAGTYSLTVTDENGCQSVTTQSLIATEGVAIESTVQAVDCFGENDGAVTLEVIGGNGDYTYLWSTGSTVANQIGLAAGEYSIIVSDSDGCTAEEIIIIEEPEELFFNSINIESSICGLPNGALEVLAIGGTGALTYEWSTGATTPTLENLVAGDYSVTATDENGCEITEILPVLESEAIEVETLVETVSCFGMSDASIDLVVSGGNGDYTFAWDDGSTMTTQTDLPEGTYTVMVTDTDGCTAEETIEIISPMELTFSGLDIIPISCGTPMSGQLLVVVEGGTGDYTYEWSNGATTPNIENLDTGEYSLTVTDENGCQLLETFTIIETEDLVINGAVETVSCFGDNNGQIDLEITGGAGVYDYLWSNGSTEENQNDLSPGEYSVVVTDANGCTGETIFIVEEPSELGFTLEAINPNPTDGGSIEILPQGGTEPYSILWNTESTDFLIDMLEAGGYSFTLTDANGCEETGTVFLELVSISLLPNIEFFDLYPNPSNGKFEVQLELKNAQRTILSIVNLQGQTLIETSREEKEINWQIDASHFPAGLYFMNVVADGKTHTVKWVKE